MVLYSNINLNQKVELRYRGRILRGSVKYKGAFITKEGDWVGVDLDTPDGQHNGMYKSRRYFECKPGHGVFVRAGNLRFMRNTKRSLYNSYVCRGNSAADQTLFGSFNLPEVQNGPYDPIFISQEMKRKSADLFDTIGSRFEMKKSYSLIASISRTIPAATMTRPHTASAPYTYTSRPIHSSHSLEEPRWEPVASIPKTHMPHSAQKNQIRRGWGNAHWIRELSAPTAKQSMKWGKWNDISF